jgi:DNA processing protein
VVSGYARGIDQIAHEAALGIPHGRTVAVLGCGIDIEYPRGSRKLFDRIKECGAVVSEYPLGTSPRAEFFPRRNRIISGLSLGVLVVEAHSRSGSLITAHEAADQGRDVFAIPGSLEQLTSRGTHRLIKEGAFLVESPQDILEILAPNLWPLASDSRLSERKEERQELISNLENSDLEKVLGLLTHGPLTYDEIAHRSAFPISQLAGMMLDLELKRKVHKHRDGRFVKSS